MLFSSLSFLYFYLPAVLLGQLLLPQAARLPFLFAASLLFYGCGEPGAVLVMLLCILLAYLAARAIKGDPPRRRLYLWLSIILLLAILAYHKYAGMVVPGFVVALPAGISFFTFQAIAYVVDVYRGQIQAETRLVPFGTFISFFPQLIAGPIERYGDIRPQLGGLRLSLPGLAQGARLFTIGLSKKLLLANPMGQLWEILRQSPATNGIPGNWLGILAFAFQIYFDFSGYSDMARGLGRMLGVTLRVNFNYPYTAASVTDFWHRWHITLSAWFREYVYIPLGGNRRGLPRQLFNILAVWALTGLWHGASWNFVLWGLYYALLLTLEKLFLLRAWQALPGWLCWLPRLATMLFVLLGWAIFAHSDPHQLGAALGGLLRGGWALPGQVQAQALSYLPLFLACALACVPWPLRLPAWAQNIALAGLLALCTAALVTQGYNPFLYFRF